MEKVRVGDLDMAYEVTGEGHPLVMIMGLTANMDWWDPVLLDALSSRYRLLVFDNRGAGRTVTPDEGEFTVAQFAEDTAGLMEAVGVEHANVLGVSMGGMIAQELVLNHPGRVDKLVLCVTYCGGKNAVFASREVLAKLADRSGTPDVLVRRFLELMYPEEWLDANPAFFEAFKERYLRAPTTDHNAARQFMATVRFDTYDRLPGIDKPTLVACGREDILIPAANSVLIAERIPGAELVEFEGAGHGFLFQCRDEFLPVLAGFLG